MLDENTVSGQERRNHNVYGNQQRIIPGGDVEHDSERLVLDSAVKAFLGCQDVGRQGFGGDVQQVVGPFEKTAEFAAGLGQRFSHLAADLFGDCLLVRAKVIQPFPDGSDSVAQRQPAPLLEGAAGRVDFFPDPGVRVKRQLDINLLIKRIDDFKQHRPISLKSRW